MAVILTIAYIIIWLVNYLSSKAQLRAINRKLEELKKADGEDI